MEDNATKCRNSLINWLDYGLYSRVIEKYPWEWVLVQEYVFKTARYLIEKYDYPLNFDETYRFNEWVTAYCEYRVHEMIEKQNRKESKWTKLKNLFKHMKKLLKI